MQIAQGVFTEIRSKKSKDMVKHRRGAGRVAQRDLKEHGTVVPFLKAQASESFQSMSFARQATLPHPLFTPTARAFNTHPTAELTRLCFCVQLWLLISIATISFFSSVPFSLVWLALSGAQVTISICCDSPPPLHLPCHTSVPPPTFHPFLRQPTHHRLASHNRAPHLVLWFLLSFVDSVFLLLYVRVVVSVCPYPVRCHALLRPRYLWPPPRLPLPLPFAWLMVNAISITYTVLKFYAASQRCSSVFLLCRFPFAL